MTLLPLTDVSVTDVSAPACGTALVREPLDADQAIALAHTMKALADPARLRLLSIVAASEGAEACVCDLTEPVGLSQPTVSHHLKVLTEAGFLTRSKRGTWAYYGLVPGALDRVSRLLIGSGGASS
ncbi:ArsR-family transcriptional regulator (Repressor) [Microbacterium sp. C448]|uniref:ArsR/SmtB family transcription factor n=1 Tax=Microbacterium TaxID=33882 RepID=UPI0003DE04BA|nr:MULTISPECIES: metalloregulator ArsR/SmtB family transcription factor [Microbacterium]MDO8384346.1 metalloregulator ArsR/SmtB family transcription factor [Microbacterium sp.]CDK01968.1 ArsR-family transcriptional regulator (Repressor) [Microbacterium sp. C448]